MKKLPKSESNLLEELRHSCLITSSHDAGGANVLEAFVRINHLEIDSISVDGPAEEIFRSLKRELNRDSSKMVPQVLLSSTGWQTDFEKNNMQRALNQGIRVIVFLDHWTNFQQRVTGSHGPIPISEFVTFDDEARIKATENFPEAKIYQFPNYYLEEQSRKIQNMRSKIEEFEFDYLYIGEPIREKEYTEADAIRNFLNKVTSFPSTNLKIAIRPHPSQSISAYKNSIDQLVYKSITVTAGTSLAEDLSRTKAVVGCNSMALEIAFRARIPIYCAIPDSFNSELPADIFSDWSENEIT